MAVAATPRPGFSLHSRQSPFFDLIGPLRPLRTDDGLESPSSWMIATTDIQNVGRRVAFANCYLHSGDRRVVRASAVFANVSEP